MSVTHISPRIALLDNRRDAWWALPASLGALAALLLSTVALITAAFGGPHAAPVSAPAQRAYDQAHAFVFDGHDLHWNPSAWQPAAGHSCATVHFDIRYGNGSRQQDFRSTFQPCQLVHALPDRDAVPCAVETWTVYRGAYSANPAADGRTVFASGRVVPCR